MPPATDTVATVVSGQYPPQHQCAKANVIDGGYRQYTKSPLPHCTRTGLRPFCAVSLTVTGTTIVPVISGAAIKRNITAPCTCRRKYGGNGANANRAMRHPSRCGKYAQIARDNTRRIGVVITNTPANGGDKSTRQLPVPNGHCGCRRCDCDSCCFFDDIGYG